MPLNRQSIIPSLDFFNTFAHNRMKHMLPTGFQWFTEETLEPEYAVGQFIEALSKVAGPMLQQTASARHATSLVTATGPQLDALGKSYGILRVSGETDDDYALRIQQTLLIERITGPAILAALQQIVPYAELFEPWRSLPIPSDNWVLSGDTHLGSPDFWNAAVFEARLYVQSGSISGLDNFFQVMKAYGVKYWLAVFLPDQFIDYNNDPLSPLVAVPTLPAFPTGQLQDPRSVSRPNSVIGSTLELVTDIIPSVGENAILSGEATIPSWSFLPSGPWEDEIYFTLDMITDYFASSTTALYAMDVLPIAMLDPASPNYATIVANNYEVPFYDPQDLYDNLVIDEDVDLSGAAGRSLLTVARSEFDGTAVSSDLQGPCLIEQLP